MRLGSTPTFSRYTTVLSHSGRKELCRESSLCSVSVLAKRVLQAERFAYENFCLLKNGKVRL